jgi:hypothetical protein
MLKPVDKHWGESQKLEACKTYLMTGNIAMTARMLKVPEVTVRYWAKSPWWKEMVDDLRSQDELVLSARLKRIVEKTFDVVEDRLEHGDYVYDQKTGEMRRKPVALRDAHKVGLELDNKRDLILSRSSPRASEEAIDDKLNKLAAKFAAIVQGRKPPDEEIVDVESKVVSNEPLSSEVLFDDGQDGFGEVLQETETGTP